MNKLYKYLPFKILLKHEKYPLQPLTAYALHAMAENESIKVKPILRSFEDLTKELPLTKAAAEMIDMKEGEIITPIEKCSYNTQNTWQYSLVESKYMFYNFRFEKDLDFLRAMKFAVDFTEWEFIKLED